MHFVVEVGKVSVGVETRTEIDRIHLWRGALRWRGGAVEAIGALGGAASLLAI